MTRYWGGDTAFALEHSDPVERSLLDAEMFEEPPPFTDQDQNEVDLEFVQEPLVMARWTMTPAPWTSTFLSPAACLASQTAASRSLT